MAKKKKKWSGLELYRDESLKKQEKSGESTFKGAAIIDYDYFETKMWKKITKDSQNAKWNGEFHASLVWTEMMSIIRGSIG